MDGCHVRSFEQIVINNNGVSFGVCNKADDDGGLLAGGKEVEHGSVDTGLRSGYNKIVTELCTRDIGCVWTHGERFAEIARGWCANIDAHFLKRVAIARGGKSWNLTLSSRIEKYGASIHVEHMRTSSTAIEMNERRRKWTRVDNRSKHWQASGLYHWHRLQFLSPSKYARPLPIERYLSPYTADSLCRHSRCKWKLYRWCDTQADTCQCALTQRFLSWSTPFRSESRCNLQTAPVVVNKDEVWSTDWTMAAMGPGRSGAQLSLDLTYLWSLNLTLISQVLVPSYPQRMISRPTPLGRPARDYPHSVLLLNALGGGHQGWQLCLSSGLLRHLQVKKKVRKNLIISKKQPNNNTDIAFKVCIAAFCIRGLLSSDDSISFFFSSGTNS